VDQEAMARYLAGELRRPLDEVARTLAMFGEYFEAHPAEEGSEVDLQAVVKWIVERTMLPWRQVERTLMELLSLKARLDEALGPDAGS
jgi:hypothetical protein